VQIPHLLWQSRKSVQRIELWEVSGIGRKQMRQSSFGGGSLKRASSCNSAARCLHGFLCFGQWFCWHLRLQYLTSIHDLHALRLTPSPSSTPQSAQLIDCIVNAVCHVSAVSPHCGCGSKEWLMPQWGVVCYGEREGSDNGPLQVFLGGVYYVTT
jgi:hypothetical protein